MSEKVLLIIREEMMQIIQRKKPYLSYEEALDVTNHIIDVVQWDNPTLMHKGIEWITSFYLNSLVST